LAEEEQETGLPPHQALPARIPQAPQIAHPVDTADSLAASRTPSTDDNYFNEDCHHLYGSASRRILFWFSCYYSIMDDISSSGLVLTFAFVFHHHHDCYSPLLPNLIMAQTNIRKKRIGISRRYIFCIFIVLFFNILRRGKSLGPQDEFGWQTPDVLVNFVES
jgi:hypothetical protein